MPTAQRGLQRSHPEAAAAGTIDAGAAPLRSSAHLEDADCCAVPRSTGRAGQLHREAKPPIQREGDVQECLGGGMQHCSPYRCTGPPWFASNSAWTIHAQQAAGDPAEPTMRMHWSAYLHDEGAASEGSSSATQHGRHRQGMQHMRLTLLGMRQAPLNASRHVGKRGPQHPHLPRSQQVSAGQKGAPEAPLVLPGRSGQVASASGGLAARLAAPIFAAQLPASRRNSSSALPTSLL
jgi:hypothetical protein